MKDRIAELESRLARVEERLSVLEGGKPAKAAEDEPVPESTAAHRMVAGAPTHIGHTLLIFGGAYLLRAITDFQFVPTAIGLFMGATYAVFWLYMAYRKGAVEAQRTPPGLGVTSQTKTAGHPGAPFLQIEFEIHGIYEIARGLIIPELDRTGAGLFHRTWISPHLES